MKRSWYCQTWFLCILFAFWFFIIPLIAGIILSICAILESRKIKQMQIIEEEKRLAAIAEEESKRMEKIAEENEERQRQIEIEKREREKKFDEEESEQKERISGLRRDIVVLQTELNELSREYSNLSKEILVESVNIDAYENLRSDEVKNQLSMLQLKQKELIKSGGALYIYPNAVSGKGLESQKKQILRCFNSECAEILNSVTLKNVDSCRGKLQKSYETINKIFELDRVEITHEYLETKLEELSMIYAFMVKTEQEREEQRAIREQLVEEDKVRREIEREKAKIEKEETQFSNEINKLMGYMQKASDDIEKQLYISKINELEEKLKLLTADKENVLQREQNTRAGFVYIISNIGSFGEHIYKIGMTRRLEPLDRVKELGDASVPFPFDVHAMIFSEDAPALESVLHQTFKKNQVNKVNARKEFFNIDLSSVEEVVKKNHNATVRFVDIPEAHEYRESLKISENA